MATLTSMSNECHVRRHRSRMDGQGEYVGASTGGPKYSAYFSLGKRRYCLTLSARDAREMRKSLDYYLDHLCPCCDTPYDEEGVCPSCGHREEVMSPEEFSTIK